MLKRFSLFSSDCWVFLKRWLSHPLRMGALCPSSKYLCAFIAKRAYQDWTERCKQDPEQPWYVLEIGSGTGCVTQALLDVGLPKEAIIALELDSDLHAHLTEKFQDVKIYKGNAAHLQDVLPHDYHQRIASVVSSIPLLVLPASIRHQILLQCFYFLYPQGRYYQFTYGPTAPISQEKGASISKKRIGFIWKNLPPASIWSYWKNA